MKKKLAIFLAALIFVLAAFAVYQFVLKKDTAELPQGDLYVHFIDVGQADSILIVCDGKTMLIDAGNNDDGDLVCNYLKAQGVEKLDYAVGTHAHEDHIGGMNTVLKEIGAGELLLSAQKSDTKTYQDVLDAAGKKQIGIRYISRQGSFSFGSGTVEILSPLKETYSSLNDSSVVIRLVYGKTSFLFTGDMESDAEKELYATGAELSANVLKVGHHGSSTSTSYLFLREVMPSYAVISVGKGNDYGHPNEETISRLKDEGAQIFRTDEMGTIVMKSDGTTISLSTGQSSTVSETASKSESKTVYVGNVNSKKFHTESCSGLPAEKNRIYFSTREEAIAAGYEPCGSCNP